LVVFQKLLVLIIKEMRSLVHVIKK
jgi:hypothetical protein